MIDVEKLDWGKMDGLIPAIVQEERSGFVRMLGYMDRAALDATQRDGLVTFFSRSRGGQWRKGETSGNVLNLVSICADCDSDALLITARASGPTCHRGSESCFGEGAARSANFISALEQIIGRRTNADPSESYTARLLSSGIKRIAQKVGEEAVETALAATSGDAAELTSEAADLVYHLLVLLHASGSSWQDVMTELERRHAASTATASS